MLVSSNKFSFFILHELNYNAKLLVIKCFKITKYIKDFNEDKHLTIN